VLVALMILFGLVARPQGRHRPATAGAPSPAANLERGRRRGRGPARPHAAAGCWRQLSKVESKLAGARLAKENPAAVANIVRGWVSGVSA
jgi:flagellar biosynthesis/type III secretory pathway M-ring protein FliF/YscJ